MTKRSNLQMDWLMRTQAYQFLVGTKVSKKLDWRVYEGMEVLVSTQIRGNVCTPVNHRGSR